MVNSYKGDINLYNMETQPEMSRHFTVDWKGQTTKAENEKLKYKSDLKID